MKGVSYRDAVERDAPALAAFSAQSFAETFGHLYPAEDLQSYLASKFSSEKQAAEISDAATHYRIAFQGETVMGYCKTGAPGLKTDPADTTPLELQRLYVAERAQGLGVSHILMEDCLDWAKKRGADALYLSVWENNLRAQNFYRRYGFKDFGEHDFMVGRVKDRDLIWRLKL